MKRMFIGIAAAASLVASGAFAVDLPMKAPAYKAPVELFTWTGFYSGLNIGYGAGQADNSTTINRFLTGLPLPGALIGTGNANNAVDGLIGGAQIGYNWQITNWLIGIEADFQGSDQRRASSSIVCLRCSDDNTNIVTNLNQSLDWFGTVRGRAGIFASPDTVFYATGGLAYG